MAQERQFGNVRQLGDGGRWQARWRLGSGYGTARTDDNRPLTFSTRRKAEQWLLKHEEDIRSGEWAQRVKGGEKRARSRGRTFRDAAEEWLEGRDLSPRTDEHYRQLLRDHVYPTFGAKPVGEVSRADVEDWWAALTTGQTAKRHAYSLTKSVFTREENRDHIDRNPCRLEKRDLAKKGIAKHAPQVLDDSAQLAALAAAMPVPYGLLIELTTLCALRFGEVTDLRREDIDFGNDVIRVHRAVARVKGEVFSKSTKTGEERELPIPSTLRDRLRTHLRDHAGRERDALVFPAPGGGWLAPSTVYGRNPTKTRPGNGFYAARAAIGRPGMHFHDLRHTGLTWLGHKGASPQVLAIYGGHKTLAMVSRYSKHETPGLLRAAQDAMLAE